MGGRLAGHRTALEGHLDDVTALCVHAQQQAPSAGLDIPGGDGGRWLDVHRDVSRAATTVAQACEAATMLRVAMGDATLDAVPDDAAVSRAVAAVGAALARAQARASA